MGNIIGEGFKKYVVDQVDIRQKKLSLRTRDTQTMLEQNSKSAWIKLTSAVKIEDREKFDIPSNVDDLAKYFTLFGGTSINNKPLGGLNAYTQFGFEQGYRPAPGILSMDTKNRNRGSVRETTVNLRAYSREQFYYIDLLYLRLGYSVLLEFGHSLYFDNKEQFQKFTDDKTITSDFLSEKYKGDHFALAKAIEGKRESSNGNYDAIFGQIRNFTWDYTTEGYYDITLSIISYGDVVESLKINSAPPETSKSENTDESNEVSVALKEKDLKDSQIITLLKDLDTIGNLFWKLKNSLKGGRESDNYEYQNNKTQVLPDQAEVDKIFGNLGYNTYDALKLYNKTGNISTYYIRFGALLQYLWDSSMLYVDQEQKTPIVQLDNDPDTTLIYKTPYTVSSNPNLTVVKVTVPIIQNNKREPYPIFREIPNEASFEVPDQQDQGKLMNVYINMAYILEEGYQLRDDKNSIYFYDLIKKITDVIQGTLGGLNSIEPVIDAEEARMYFVDQHAIPSLAQDRKAEEPELAEFTIYGLEPGSKGSFITDFGIKTSITNALATTLTVGAQANGNVKGLDGTAFATWNSGLIDRVLTQKQLKGSKGQTTQDRINLENKNRAILTQYLNFLNQLKQSRWTKEKASEFETILANMLNLTEGASSEAFKGTKGGVIGFLPIDLNLSMVGLSGMKIYQRFKVTQAFLPYNYPETLQFLITGISHKIQDNKWVTSVETNVVPETVVDYKIQDFTGISVKPLPTSEDQEVIKAQFPSTRSQGVRLKLYRKADNGTSTLGKLQVLNTSGTVIVEYNTVERPWQGNARAISCIPPGTYNFVKSIALNNPALGDVLRLSDPRNRSGVLVHVGNKPTDSQGCILPNKDGISTVAMKEILTKLYPATAPGQTPPTFTIEVYGVPGKSYVDQADGTVYQGPGQDAFNPDQEASKANYITLVNELDKIYQLKDNYGANSVPLLQAAKGFNDDERRAINRIKALFNIIRQDVNNERAPWQNRRSLSDLSVEHKKLFKAELGRLFTATNSRKEYKFRYPTAEDSPTLTDEGLLINTDF